MLEHVRCHQANSSTYELSQGRMNKRKSLSEQMVGGVSWRLYPSHSTPQTDSVQTGGLANSVEPVSLVFASPVEVHSVHPVLTCSYLYS